MRRFTYRRYVGKMMRIQIRAAELKAKNKKKRDEEKKKIEAQHKKENIQVFSPSGKLRHIDKPFDILKTAIKHNLRTNNKIICHQCGCDYFAVIPRKLIFLKTNIIYCEFCRIPLKLPDRYGYINEMEFNKIISQ